MTRALYKTLTDYPWPRLLRLGWFFSLLFLGLTGPAAAQERPADLRVRIGRPAEGETFYSSPNSLLYSIPINGWAFSDSYPSEALEVQLEVIQSHTVLFSQTIHPEPDGSFLFEAEVNPGNTLASFEIAFQGCADQCHDLSAQQLPVGDFLLRVTARDPAGGQASDQRQVTVDRSTIMEVPVRLVLQADQSGFSGRLPAGVQISGSAQLYLWRNRGALGTSDPSGLASVPVEMLSQAPTHYTIEVHPQVVDGILIQGLETPVVTLLPGQADAPEITLRVQAQTGRISGQIAADAVLPATLPVLAFELPTGQAHQAQSSDQAFAFEPLPIDHYLVTADPHALSEVGCTSTSVEVNLATNPQAQAPLTIKCNNSQPIVGRIQSEDNQPLPFAWVDVEQSPQSAVVLPDSGRFQLPALATQAYTLVASAPGYYSEARRVSIATGRNLVFTLVRRPETTRLAWGTGEVLLPPENQFSYEAGTLNLSSGWVWGSGGGAQPMLIQAGEIRLQIASGSFALSVQPDKDSWLYLFAGQAEVQRAGESAVGVQSGQMVLLSGSEALTPVAYQPIFVQEFSQAPGASPVWQPTPGAIWRDRMARLGLNTAQALTFLVYTLAMVSLLLGPVLALYMFLRRRARR